MEKRGLPDPLSTNRFPMGEKKFSSKNPPPLVLIDARGRGRGRVPIPSFDFHPFPSPLFGLGRVGLWLVARGPWVALRFGGRECVGLLNWVRLGSVTCSKILPRSLGSLGISSSTNPPLRAHVHSDNSALCTENPGFHTFVVWFPVAAEGEWRFDGTLTVRLTGRALGELRSRTLTLREARESSTMSSRTRRMSSREVA
ncbi:hypothetical protein K493DRAFT_359414 [Basidiobolus meristosporus CBS 931.73]|uniref:Uncharacterized protein n=1 Tax=Basidiobolus meristosporus CBS 931.73 TaxID=1314790 RepID=A0A1Y1XRZ6_9FUNG|nr:hypothetical protein K493DRAFT_359414 [Basidiobolus meristosporus CBS 931.73]|eukprot:ORX88528.1 hypothetical protein K493DRAFT_359414 [Basidiobolus meristosporus CBS 931.73]